MSVLSIVDNPKTELERMDKENENASVLARNIAVNERRTDADLLGVDNE